MSDDLVTWVVVMDGLLFGPYATFEEANAVRHKWLGEVAYDIRVQAVYPPSELEGLE